ncbi:hypothetical protein M441DRAFT_268863 [Trichoderma asperellum CBS 433.97]|uniref:Uncharacterized protein n=1 Tax=Trichoderma asperellum (strain ATCC 204424 / CBS 433.97 / NBRC 101777) TaxID=1042311 RepID=A0A2T3YW14_TRIA4|nr:hypothetical protein M441DRAFT_268863 [Trichoderma asperellum CBS 433.97]PTB36753.1 hypothetical protein M441DRAFT_268863 [Trichoderma asperellum CBS 433.97]
MSGSRVHGDVVLFCYGCFLSSFAYKNMANMEFWKRDEACMEQTQLGVQPRDGVGCDSLRLWPGMRRAGLIDKRISRVKPWLSSTGTQHRYVREPSVECIGKKAKRV